MPWSDAPVPSPPLLSPWPLLELLSLASLLCTWLLALCCCLSPWMEFHFELVELERVQVGLWSDCVVQDMVFSCKAHSSLLNLPPALLLGRGLLLGALVSGATAIAVTVLGLSLLHTPKVWLRGGCSYTRVLHDLQPATNMYVPMDFSLLKCRQCLGVAASWALKRRLRGCGGVLCLVSAVLEAFPVSWAGHITAQRFRQDAVLGMAPRWDLGLGLFLGWTSASLYVLTAGALWSSCREDGGARTQGGGAMVQRGGARQEYV